MRHKTRAAVSSRPGRRRMEWQRPWLRNLPQAPYRARLRDRSRFPSARRRLDRPRPCGLGRPARPTPMTDNQETRTRRPGSIHRVTMILSIFPLLALLAMTPAQSEPLAEVDGETITAEEVETALAAQFAKLEEQI